MRFIRPFDSLTLDDIPLVGGKNASFGEMIRSLRRRSACACPTASRSRPTPTTRCSTARACATRCARRSRGIDLRDVDSPARRRRVARRVVREAPVPPELLRQLEDAYAALSQQYGEQADGRRRALERDRRGPAHGELRGPAGDLPERARAAGAARRVPQLLRVALHRPRDRLPRPSTASTTRRSPSRSACRRWCAPTWPARACCSRSTPRRGFDDVVLINAAYGLGENVVQGGVNPDEYVVFKPTLRGFRPISGALGAKEIEMVYDEGGRRGDAQRAGARGARAPVRALATTRSLALARWAVAIEEHYTPRGGRADARWTSSGPRTARPASSSSCRRGPRRSTRQRDAAKLVSYRAEAARAGAACAGERRREDRRRPVARHRRRRADARLPAGRGARHGDDRPRLGADHEDAAAIVTDRGGRTCHAAIVARELGIPCVVGTGDATDRAQGRASR